MDSGNIVIIVAVVLLILAAITFMLRRNLGGGPTSMEFPTNFTPSNSTPLVAQVDLELRELLEHSNKIAAIQLVRERTGMGLKEAKDYVEALAAGKAAALPAGTPAAPKSQPADILPQVYELLANNKKLEAIKLVRKRTGMGLKEAKDYVEGLPVVRTSMDPQVESPGMVSLDGLRTDPELRDLLARSNKIMAIKLVRERTGVGLKDAKDFVDRL